MPATASRALGALLLPWALLACAQDEPGIERRRPQPSAPAETRMSEIAATLTYQPSHCVPAIGRSPLMKFGL